MRSKAVLGLWRPRSPGWPGRRRPSPRPRPWNSTTRGSGPISSRRTLGRSLNSTPAAGGAPAANSVSMPLPATLAPRCRSAATAGRTAACSCLPMPRGAPRRRPQRDGPRRASPSTSRPRAKPAGATRRRSGDSTRRAARTPTLTSATRWTLRSPRARQVRQPPSAPGGLRAALGGRPRGRRPAPPAPGDLRPDAGRCGAGARDRPRGLGGRAVRLPATAYPDCPRVPTAGRPPAWTTAPRRCARTATARATTTPSSRCRWSSSALRWRSRTSCAAVWPSRCRRSSSSPASTMGATTRCATTSRSCATARSATSTTCCVAVTLSPVMGDYLDMVNNNKANPATGTYPNENYAREILQLFTIGLFELNADGRSGATPPASPSRPTTSTRSRDSRASSPAGRIPPSRRASPRNNNPRNYLGSMIPVAANHEFGTKQLLGGVTSPANLTPQADLAFAHRNIFEHPNVGPFVGKQLIQKLVTSDPTPGYVERVARVFANNGAGHARRPACGRAGHPARSGGARRAQDRPGLRQAHRAGALHDGRRARPRRQHRRRVLPRRRPSHSGSSSSTRPRSSTTTRPTTCVAGTAILGPEFGIQTTNTAIARANVANGPAVLGPNRARPRVLRCHRHRARPCPLPGRRRRTHRRLADRLDREPAWPGA